VVIALLAQAAVAGTLVTSVAAGHEGTVLQPWAGVDLAWRPTGDAPLQPLLRLTAGAGAGPAPTVIADVGFLVRVPEDEAIVRAGVIARAIVDRDALSYPIEFGGRDPKIGLIPIVLGQVEFEWDRKVDFGVGAQLGAGPRPTDVLCTNGASPADCLRWVNGFHGGFLGWFRLRQGLSVDVVAGIDPRVAVGWAW